MVEDASDAQIFSLTVATRHQDLRTDAETETEHEDGDVEDATQGGGSEFNLTDSSEEGGVGHADELLHEGAQKNRIGDDPDLRVFVGGRHDAARETGERKRQKTSGERRNGSSSSPLVKVLSGAVPHFSN